MANYARWRDIHLWVGLILLLPVTVIAATGFLWNHEKSLGIKKEPAAAQQKVKKPHGHQQPERVTAGLSADSSHAMEHGAMHESLKAGARAEDYLPALNAAIAASQETWGPETGYERIELRNEPGYGLVVKVKVPEDSGMVPEEIMWSVAEERVVMRRGDPKAGMDWAKLVHDLHTGKFFSRNYGYFWSDSGAIAILLLGGTGLVLYVLPFLKKRANRKKRGAAVTPERPAPLAKAGEPLPVALAQTVVEPS